jgi:hypothetical protein
MEILIIGVILVAIMAYVSTKIKNAAKEAYNQENFENEYFTILKPEGFIIPVKVSSEFLFETYSKDLGEEIIEEEFYQCRATVTEKAGIEVETELLETEESENGLSFKTFSKTLVNQNLKKSFNLKIFVLPEYQEKYTNEINLMLGSFTLK